MSGQITFSIIISFYQSRMEQILQQKEKINELINQHSTMCPKSQYPMLIFMLGFLSTKAQNLSGIYQFLEVMFFLKAQKKITQNIESHIFLLINEKPFLLKKIQTILYKILKNQISSILIQLQKISQQHPNPHLSQINKKQDMNTLIDKDSANNDIGQKNMSTVQFPKSNNTPIQLQNIEKLPHQFLLQEDKLWKESLLLAQKLQEEEQQQDEKNNVNKEQEQIFCQICYVGLYAETFVLLQNCEHIFHKNCLLEFCKVQISENNFPLKCPNDQCKVNLSDIDAKEILDESLFQKYEKHTLIFYADLNGDSISWCPTADCQYMFFFEKDDDPHFECPECSSHFCLNCRTKWHSRMTCEQYKVSNTHTKQDDLFLKFVKGKKFKQCPKCKFWVQKTKGCNHMTCKCKFQFCYKCGGKFRSCECTKKQKEIQKARRDKQLQLKRKKVEKMRQKKLQKMASQKNVQKVIKDAKQNIQIFLSKQEIEQIEKPKDESKKKGKKRQ